MGTVTATVTNVQNVPVLKVWAITGVNESGGNVVCSGGWATPQFSLTPAASGSIIVESVYNANSAIALTPGTNNTQDNAGTATLAYWFGRYTGTITNGVAVNLGGTNDNGWNAWAGYELTPNGTPAIDPSTPAAAAGSGSSATTANFSPPQGAVLVAIVESDGTAAQTITMSDTFGGLTWTLRGTVYSAGYQGTIGIYTAIAPAPPPISKIGTPTKSQSTGVGTPKTQTSQWGTGQDRATGDLLVALVTASGSTSAGTITENTAYGWNKIYEGGGTYVKAAIFTKTATGGDAAPTFQSTIAGTAARCHTSVTLWQLHGNNGATPVLDTGNQVSGTSGTLSVSTAAALAVAGEFALACQSMQYTTSGANTWGAVGSWSQIATDAVSAYYHYVDAEVVNPASGSALTYNPTHSLASTGIGAAIAAFKPGIVIISVTGAVTMKKMTISADGEVVTANESVATGAVKMKKMTIAGASTGISVATGAVSQKKLKVAASGAGFADVIGAVKTKKMTVSASGTKVSTATAAISMKKMAVASASAGISVSTGAVKLKKMTVSGTGAGFADVTGAPKLKKFTVAGAGAGFTDATGAVKLKKMTVAGTGGPGAEESNATGAITLKKMSLSGSGAGISISSGGPKLKKMTVSGAGAGIAVASGGPKLKKMTIAAASTGITVVSGGPGLKKMRVSGSGAGVAVVISGPSLKKMTVAGTGTAISAGPGAIRMKKFTILGIEGEIAIFSGGAGMKKMSVAGSGAGISVTSGGPVLKKMKVSGSGAGISAASASVTLKKMKVLGVGAGLVIVTGDVVLKKLVISGAGEGIAVATIAVTMKKMEVEGEAVKKVKADNMMIFSML